MRRARLLLPALVTAVLATVLAVGCTAPAPPVPGPAGGATPGPTTPGPTTPGGPTAAVGLPWPARSAAEATGLQQAADSGAQPWLLDPEETALSYAAAAFGWTTATTERTTPGTVVVTGPDGSRRTLVLAQPVRPGPGGIWSVTAES